MGWRDESLRRGLRPHRCAKLIAPTCGGPKGSCRRTATSTWPSMPTRSRRSARTHPTSTRPRARLLIRLTSTDLPSDQFSVFLLSVQKGVMMTNKPPQGLRAATTSSASSYDPTRSYRSRTSFATRLFAAATRTIRALYKIATASRLYSLPEQV